MTTYSDTFAGHTAGSAPPDWTSEWDAATDWTIQSTTSDAEDDRVFETDGSGSGTGGWSGDAWDGDANRAEAEIVARFRVDTVDDDLAWYLVARGSGTGAADETGYFLRIVSGFIEVKAFKAGVEDALDTTAHDQLNADEPGSPYLWHQGNDNYTHQPLGKWIWARLRVSGVGATVTVQGKVWTDGEPEPSDWTVQGVDTETDRITAAGWIGLARSGHNASTATEFDYVGVGTNGDPAPITQDATNPVRTTATTAHAALQEGDPVVRTTATTAHAALQSSGPDVRTTATTAHAAVQEAAPELRVTQHYVQVLLTEGPSLGSPKLMVIT